MPDYLPPSDNDFNSWLANFATKLTSMQAALSLSAASVTDISNARAEFDEKLGRVTVAQTTLAANVQDKNESRGRIETQIRTLVNSLQVNPALTNAQRAELNISIPDGTRTPPPVAATRPIAVIDTSQPQRHTIQFMDEATPTRRKKPDGMMGVEIRVQVGGAEPVEPDEMRFLAIDTSTPYVADFDGADAGKTAYYRLRWLNTRQQAGPWSDIYSATITK